MTAIKKPLRRELSAVLVSFVIGALIFLIGHLLWRATIPRFVDAAGAARFLRSGGDEELRLPHFWFAVRTLGFLIAFGGGYAAYLAGRLFFWLAGRLRRK